MVAGGICGGGRIGSLIGTVKDRFREASRGICSTARHMLSSMSARLGFALRVGSARPNFCVAVELSVG